MTRGRHSWPVSVAAPLVLLLARPMPRGLSAEELRAAQQMLGELRNVQLVKPAGRGRGLSLPPIAAAMAVRRGAFHKIGGAALSTESQETAAATDYGVAVGKVREYTALLNQMAPVAGARPLQTMGAALERLRTRLHAQQQELREVGADGNCQYRAMAIALQDLGVLSVQQGYFKVRSDLADFLEANHDKESGSNELGESTGTIFDEALADVSEWKKPELV